MVEKKLNYGNMQYNSIFKMTIYVKENDIKHCIGLLIQASINTYYHEEYTSKNIDNEGNSNV